MSPQWCSAPYTHRIMCMDGLAVPLEGNPPPCLVTDVQPADPASPVTPMSKIWELSRDQMLSHDGIHTESFWCRRTGKIADQWGSSTVRQRSKGDRSEQRMFHIFNPLNAFKVGNNIESVGKYNTVNLNWIPFWSISMIISHMNLVSCTALKQCFNSFSCLETSFSSTTATKYIIIFFYTLHDRFRTQWNRLW